LEKTQTEERVKRVSLLVSLAGLWIVCSCTPEDSERCGDGFIYDDGECIALDTDTDTFPYEEVQTIGSACTCQGPDCAQMDVPVPAAETIIGCDDTPDDWTGGVRVCLRTYTGDMAPSTYFANGYCSVMAVRCTGDDLICGSAEVGQFTSMTACPAGTVLLESTVEVSVQSMSATIENKICAAGCATDEDCRTTETDPVLDDEPTQYQCVDRSGVTFCYDPRNLSPGDAATSF
jgi:hypothetical protein